MSEDKKLHPEGVELSSEDLAQVFGGKTVTYITCPICKTCKGTLFQSGRYECDNCGYKFYPQ